MRTRLLFPLLTCLLSVCLGMLGIVNLAGCAQLQSASDSIDKNQVAVKLVIQYAVFKYAEHFPIEQRPQHMANVDSVVSNLRAVVASDELTNLQLLDSALYEQLDKLHLSDADKFMAKNLADLIETELQQRIGKGSFDAKMRVQVVQILDWISEAAGLAA
jgi:hypothetical protein